MIDFFTSKVCKCFIHVDQSYGKGRTRMVNVLATLQFIESNALNTSTKIIASTAWYENVSH